MTEPRVFVGGGVALVRILSRAVDDAQQVLAAEMVKQVAEARGVRALDGERR